MGPSYRGRSRLPADYYTKYQVVKAADELKAGK
jgi:hypothetical protein